MDNYDGAEMCSAVAMGTYVLLGRHFTRRVVCVEALGVSGAQLMKKHAMSASLGKACKAHRTAMAGWPPARPREIKMTAYWTGCAAPHNTLPIFFFPFSHIFLSFFFLYLPYSIFLTFFHVCPRGVTRSVSVNPSLPLALCHHGQLNLNPCDL